MKQAGTAVDGVPSHELDRSTAARRVGRLASDSGLFAFNFEHRYHLPLPPAWRSGRADLEAEPTWRAGSFAEPKYQAFRHDCLLASFHPGHRAKWSAHELCHGLVGFAWRPTASRFFSALAARMAEVLPVALWYFFDEAGLLRCSEHAGGGPLHSAFCPACEAAAEAPGEDRREAPEWEGGIAFVERELAAIAQSAERGQMVGHRLGALDLSSDGLAYAAAHSDRLESDEMAAWVERFCDSNSGWHDSLESMEERVRAVLTAIVGGADPRPWSADRWTWVSQDLGARLFQVAATLDGESFEQVVGLIDTLSDHRTEAGVTAALQSYSALATRYGLLAAPSLAAVGYPLPGGFGSAPGQLQEGAASGLPRTVARYGAAVERAVAQLCDPLEAPARQPLSRRLLPHLEHPARELARLESALSHPAPPDALALTCNAYVSPMPDDPVIMSPSTAVLASDIDLLALADGEIAAGDDAPDERSLTLLIPEPGGQVAVVPLDPRLEPHLPREPTPWGALTLPAEIARELLALGALRLMRYPLDEA